MLRGSKNARTQTPPQSLPFDRLRASLCHAHADSASVRALYTRLTKDGVDAWLDKEKLLPGQDWEREIRKAVHVSDVVVICLSQQFNQAGFRQKEIKWALDTAMELPEGEIFIVPARLEECDAPESLKKLHRVDLFEDDGYEILMSSLRFKAHKSVLSVKPPKLGKLIPKTEKTILKPFLPPYAPEKFVNRYKEIEAVISMLKDPRPRTRAIVFEGERGTGKLWLSLHLHRTKLKELNGITSWLFSLAPVAEGYKPWGKKMRANEYFVKYGKRFEIDKFLLNIAKNLFVELPHAHTIFEIVADIRRYMQNHSDKRFVLILDSAYESEWSLLEQLETYLLGDLLKLKNFFVIITGRGRPYPWRIPHLIEAIRFKLEKFSLEQTQEQLVKFGLSSTLPAQNIYNVGGGWPLFTNLIAHAKSQTDALEITADVLFGIIPIQERSQLRRYFEALCPLDGFGESEAALMVRAYDPVSDEKDGRVICRKMNETHLVSWQQGRYVLDRSVQEILRQYLLLFKREDWIHLNCVAYHHFQSQCEDPALNRFRSYFEGQMKIHAQALFEAGVSDLTIWQKI